MTSERGTSVLGPAPIGWIVMPLGEVVERAGVPVSVKPDEMYFEIGIRSHGKGVFHKEAVSGACLGNKRVFSIVPNCLVFNIVFAWEGAVAVTRATESGMIGSHRFPMFAPTAAHLVDVEFLLRFFHTKEGVRLLGDASPGGAGRNRTLNQKLLAELSVPIPPLGEQKKIVAILQAVDEAIQTTQAVIDQLGVVKKALMAELLTRGIPGRHTKFRQTEIGEVPEGWEVTPLSNVAFVQTGVAKGKQTANGVEIPYLRVANVQDGHVDLSEVKTIAVAHDAVARYALQLGDVLFTEGGDADKLGRGCVWMGQINPCLHQNHVFAVRMTTNRLLPAYLACWAASPRGRSYFMNSAKQTTNLASINSTQLKAFPVAIPPTAEQEKIVSALGTIESRMTIERAGYSYAVSLRKSLMSLLLTGDLRVPPAEDPT